MENQPKKPNGWIGAIFGNQRVQGALILIGFLLFCRFNIAVRPNSALSQVQKATGLTLIK